MEFLASDEALDLPDRIEEVNAKRLDAQINEKTFIAVLFRKNGLLSGHITAIAEIWCKLI